MKELLSNLEMELSEKNPDLINCLNKGASHIDVTAYFQLFALSTSATDDLFQLYLWHNGTIKNDQTNCLKYCLFPDFYLLSLQEIENVIYTDYYYNFRIKRFLPIFRSCGGDYLAVSIDEHNSKRDCKVYFCSPRIANDMNSLSMFDGLKMLFTCALLSYKKNYYFINPDDQMLDEEFENVYKLNSEMNKLSEYWNSDEII